MAAAQLIEPGADHSDPIVQPPIRRLSDPVRFTIRPPLGLSRMQNVSQKLQKSVLTPPGLRPFLCAPFCKSF